LDISGPIEILSGGSTKDNFTEDKKSALVLHRQALRPIALLNKIFFASKYILIKWEDKVLKHESNMES